MTVSGSNRLPQQEIIEAHQLLAAYASGYFPMADHRDGTIRWFSPDPRAVIPLQSFRVTRSLRRTLAGKAFEIRLNTSFERVIRLCGAREDTWISETIVQSYLRLHTLGYAHSVEAWKDRELAGGLYGVALGAAFFGESMFTRTRDASKVALVHLVERLRARKFVLLDTQFLTPHLARFGAVEISRDLYLKGLAAALERSPAFID